MEYKIINGDITSLDVDVIVNAWNRNLFPYWLLLPQGVSRAIKKKCGTAPFKELAHMSMIPLGKAVLTGPGKGAVKAIIHVAGINLLWFATEKSIGNSVKNAIRLAQEQQFKSIAIPLIGSGSGNRSREKSLKILKETISSIPGKMDVFIVQF